MDSSILDKARGAWGLGFRDRELGWALGLRAKGFGAQGLGLWGLRSRTWDSLGEVED